ncbi:MAG: SufD family Fe-S cluster assembly protein [Ruminococcus sp.]|uniref:SufB/SufD family protein n=1 Tax=Ruminococcus sp. TaxID=41978 RepID=UPI0025EAA720|nr:SufD family Fe-S cluster assembly protein [Ruminococcus sp.]MBO4866453.1 SufD family Fe-S cluster assembly protein [Ruminococcus sp.]
MSETKINILPVPTFRWLGVNDYKYDLNEFETDTNAISVSENESKSEVVYIDREGSTDIHINAENGSKVKLVQVFDVKGQAKSKVTAELGENASLELVELFLGGEVVSEIVTDLKGRKASFETDIGFKLDSGDKLDINLIADHHGRKTVSRINASGVLGGDAEKTFKGTIDFKNGSDGAKGAEKEEVLLMSDTAVNKTVPLILCAEENVEGSHGASVGRIDEKQFFYMQSRGIDEEKIYDLAAQAKLAKVISRIDDKETLSRIYARLGRGDESE